MDFLQQDIQWLGFEVAAAESYPGLFEVFDKLRNIILILFS